MNSLILKQNYENSKSIDRYYVGSQNKINSNSDLKNLRFESSGNLNKQNAINSDSLVHILQKNIVTVGSEPNLTINNREFNSKTLCEKSVTKESLDRKLSCSKDNIEEIYTFPSLTDFSFNFTSLAAQKILQGASLNSIDTLVELSMDNNDNKQKSNNQKVCKDYGVI